MATRAEASVAEGQIRPSAHSTGSRGCRPKGAPENSKKEKKGGSGGIHSPRWETFTPQG
ncbi:hypothetical protein HMPREF9946_05038 [Acetobacteraceae bacterium AT-5844]|nr:hypothetical protein HMPREF9946_05038 [Acetobacteraceae bacterium AT-5844]